MEEADGAIFVRRGFLMLVVRTAGVMPARIMAVKRFHHEDGQQRSQQQRCDDGSSFRTCYHNLSSKLRVQSKTIFFNYANLPQRHVEHHHKHEAECHAYGAYVGVSPTLRLGNKLFDHDINHCSRGESEQIGQHGQHDMRKQDGNDASYRLDDAGEGAVRKGFHPRAPGAFKGHGNDGAFGEVLYGDTDRERHGAGQRDVHRALYQTGQHDAHGHPLGDVMQRDGEDEHCHAFQSGRPNSFGLIGMEMEVRDNTVEQKQEGDAPQKADGGRQPCRHGAVAADHLDRRDEQRPYGGRDHDARGETEHQFLQAQRNFVLQQKDHRRAQKRSQKREQ